MAKKRLNKKIAIFGLIAFALFVIAVIAVIAHYNQDPQKFIDDAQAAIQAKDYEKAEKSFGQAFRFTKTNAKRIDLYFQVIDMYLSQDKWDKAAGSWNKIITMDPKNPKARLELLKYFYELADSGIWNQWKNVASNAEELLKIEPSPFAYLAKARAAFEISNMGQTADRETAIKQAVEYLEEALKYAPENTDIYNYLAEAKIKEGEILASTGSLDAKDKAFESAQELLKNGIDKFPQNPELYVKLIDIKMRVAANDKQKIEELEQELLSLVKRFPASAAVYDSLAISYGYNPNKIDKAVEAAAKAVELNPQKITYAQKLAMIYYRQYCLLKDTKAIENAILTSRNILALPQIQSTSGPRSLEAKSNRLFFNVILATCYIEEIFNYPTKISESQKQSWIMEAEKAVHEITQLLGSGENPYCVMWDGMILLAKEDRNNAIKKLYAAYEQLLASVKPDAANAFSNLQLANLSYTLAKLFENSSEIGASTGFISTAVQAGIAQYKPEALLDYAAILIRMKDFGNAILLINAFEENFSPTPKSKLLLIYAYSDARAFEQAEQALAYFKAEDSNSLKAQYVLSRAKASQLMETLTRKQMAEDAPEILRSQPSAETASISKDSEELMEAELDKYRATQLDLYTKLAAKESNFVNAADMAALCNNYLSSSKIEEAKKVVAVFQQYIPNDTTVLLFNQFLGEPDPTNISQARKTELTLKVLSGISNPIERSLALGEFYETTRQPDKAIEEYKKVLETDPANATAVSASFDLSLAKKDMETAEKMAQAAGKANLDSCQGEFFAARLAFAKEQYQKAMENINNCIKLNPVFSSAYRLRSTINAAMGQGELVIADLQKASSLNPLDSEIARNLVIALYRRDQQLGDKASAEQKAETQRAFQRAVQLAPRDTQLLGFYAEYISDQDPMRALALRQYLQTAVPNVENAFMLGNLATKIAAKQYDSSQKQALFNIAAAAYEQAYKADPNNKFIINAYCEFYRQSGQEGKAEALLSKSEDKNISWTYYLRNGKFERAREILDELYTADPKNQYLVKGLLAVAEETKDQNDIMKYSSRLLELDSSAENQVLQIQLFFENGLTKEAEDKFAIFKEKYPTDTRLDFLQAMLLARKGQLDKALEYTNRCLESNQENAMAWRLRGQINYLTANYEQAVNDFQKSKAIKTTPQIRMDLAKTYIRLNKAEEAITELTFAAEGENVPLGARELLERIYLDLGKIGKLDELYIAMVEEFPADVYWHKQAGAFLIVAGNLDKATELYEKAWQNSQSTGGDIASLDGYLKALLINKRYEKLIKYASGHIDGKFASIALARIGDAKFQMGDQASAVEFYRSALDKAGTDELTVLTLLKRMNELFGREETVKWCEKKLQSNPDSLAANLAMFKLNYMEGQYNSSLKYADKCLTLIEPERQEWLGLMLSKVELLNLLYAKTNDKTYLAQAIREYEGILKKAPENVSVINNLAYLLADNEQDLPRALQLIEQACKLSPNNPDFLDTYAFVLCKNGQYEKAVETEQMAVQLFENLRGSVPVEAYEHLANAYEKLNQPEQALAAYNMAQKTAANNPDVLQKINNAIERLSNKKAEVADPPQGSDK